MNSILTADSMITIIIFIISCFGSGITTYITVMIKTENLRKDVAYLYKNLEDLKNSIAKIKEDSKCNSEKFNEELSKLFEKFERKFDILSEKLTSFMISHTHQT